MTSRTETVLQALVAALTAKAQEVDSPLVAPLRNESLFARMTEGDDAIARYLNVWDGEGEPTDELLGADADPTIDDDADVGRYDIEHRATLEWAVAGGSDAAREAAFDAGLVAIHDAVRPAVSGDTRTYLGGAVGFCTIERIGRSGSGLVTDGLPNVKAAEITVRLEFTSPRPF